jgi:hypothetical protein
MKTSIALLIFGIGCLVGAGFTISIPMGLTVLGLCAVALAALMNVGQGPGSNRKPHDTV